MSLSAVEDAIGYAEEADSEGSPMAVYLIGREYEDSRGTYTVVTGASPNPGYSVGMCVLSIDGGTEPDETQVSEFKTYFPKGILMVIDPCAEEFSLYVAEGDDVRKASALLSG